MSVLALIPARAGSKRVPLKNFKSLHGSSLVELAVAHALTCGCADQVVVSTDRPDLVKATAGLQVHTRSVAAASDEASALDVIDDVLRAYSGVQTLIYLQPTSPFRTAEDIQNAYRLFVSGRFDSVVSVSAANPAVLFSLKVEEGARASFLFPDALTKRTQELPPVYTLNGAVYIASVDHLKRTRSFVNGRVGVSIMTEQASLDIDTPEDWQKAERSR